jgi:trimeric autotransporter adhesin
VLAPSVGSTAIGNLNASAINAGTLAFAQLPLTGIAAGTYGSVGNYIPITSVNTQGQVTSFGSIAIGNLNGSAINAGTLAIAQIGTIPISSVNGLVSSQWSAVTNGISYTNGSVGIGTTTPGYMLDVNGSAAVRGTLYTASGGVSSLSDARFKDIHGPYDRGLDAILKINTIRYNYLQDNPMQADPTVEHVGVTAQNLEQTIPEAVNHEKEGYLTINSSPVMWTLLNAVKELYGSVTGTQADVDQLKTDNTTKDERIKNLEQEVSTLKQESSNLKTYLCTKDPSAPVCK